MLMTCYCFYIIPKQDGGLLYIVFFIMRYFPETLYFKRTVFLFPRSRYVSAQKYAWHNDACQVEDAAQIFAFQVNAFLFSGILA